MISRSSLKLVLFLGTLGLVVACSDDTSDDGAGGAGSGNGSGGSGGMEVSCYAGEVCDPTSDTSCTNGGACDLLGSKMAFYCYPEAASATKGQACDHDGSDSTMFCVNGLRCHNNVCTPYCCDDMDCDTGKTCTDIESDTVAKLCL